MNKILVKIKKQGEKYSIVQAYSTEELKELGFSNEEIVKYNNYKKIAIYDEVLLNPDLSQLD